MSETIAGQRQPAHRVIAGEGEAGQRIDNFLATYLKGLPRARLYRILRRGEVRVNSGRVRQHYRLRVGDVVRIPPLVLNRSQRPPPASGDALALTGGRIVYEDSVLLAIDKPAGLAVHGGSGLSFGVIECLRALRPGQRQLELVHRLDRDTSGCLLVAKKRSALTALHTALRTGKVRKRYLALVHGRWDGGERRARGALLKNVLRSGERMVTVDPAGKPASTVFRPLACGDDASLLEVEPVTGRTHQIRVHAASLGHPVAGDGKYGDKAFDQNLREVGLRRLFLHAATLDFRHPGTGEPLRVDARLPEELVRVLDSLGLVAPSGG